MHDHRSELGTLPHLSRRADGRVAVGRPRALGITQPTAGRHVAALEAAFGQTLFTRSPSGLLPTEAAVALRGHAEALRSAAAAFERAAASHGAGVRGIVRISASDVIAVEVLPPMLAQLRRDHPELVIELVSTDRIQDVLNREADIAVRMAPPAQDARRAAHRRDRGRAACARRLSRAQRHAVDGR
jgi:DNA-binding transcriptional LysR family regulator